MHNYFHSALALSLMIINCVPLDAESSQTGSRQNPLLYGFNETVNFADLQEGDILAATDVVLAESATILEKVLSVPNGSRTFDNTILPLDNLYNVTGKVDNPAGLMSEVHTSAAIRDEADSSMILFSKFMNDLSVNEDLYNAIVAFSETDEGKNLTGVKKRYLDDEIRSFERQGIALPKEKREELTTIKNNLTQLLIEFGKNISEYADTLIVTEKQMEGTPDSYKESMFDSNAGVYKIDISYPSRRIFMNYSESEETRRALSEKFLNRAADENVELIPKFLAERQKMADMLGYDSYAAYVLEDRMPKTPETVWAFEEELKIALKEKSDLELAELLEFKTKDEGVKASEIEYWELNYLENVRAEEKYQVDEEEVKQYFELQTVLKGLSRLLSKFSD